MPNEAHYVFAEACQESTAWFQVSRPKQALEQENATSWAVWSFMQ